MGHANSDFNSNGDAYLRDLNGPSAGRLITILEGETPIGRRPGPDGVIVESDFLDTSRVHAKIIRQGNRLSIIDVGTGGTGTPFGTTVNGEMIPPLVKYQLEDNAVIRLGSIGGKQFRFVNPVTGTVRQKYTSKDIRVDVGQNNVCIKGEELDPPLPPLQTRVLKAFHDRVGVVITRQALVGRSMDREGRRHGVQPCQQGGAAAQLPTQKRDEIEGIANQGCPRHRLQVHSRRLEIV